MSHYTTLGVPPDATDDQIKAAYRRTASRHHPDRAGGDAKLAAEANQAYAVLSDPERRARYDATGSDDQAPSDDDNARKILMEALNANCDQPHWIECTRKSMQSAQAQATAEAAMQRRRANRLEQQLARVVFKGAGENIAAGLVTHRIQMARNTVAGAESAAAMIERALVLLADYEDVPQEPAVNIAQGRNRTTVYAGPTITSGFWTG